MVKFKKVITGLIAVVLLFMYTSPIMAQNPAHIGKVNNQVTTLIQQVETYYPSEISALKDGENPHLQTYMRYAKYIYYVNKMVELVENERASVSELFVASSEQHKNNVSEIAPLFGGLEDPVAVLEYVMEFSEQGFRKVMVDLQGLNSDQEKRVEFNNRASALKDFIKYWADAVRFYADNLDIDRELYREQSEKIDESYNIFMELSRGTGYEVNIGTFTPNTGYEESATISQNIVDENNKLKSGYVEILTLSSLTEGEPLETYEEKLTAPSRKMLERYSRYRVPLYVGNESEPIKALNSKGNKNLKLSNLANFLENARSEEVLYAPLYTKDLMKIAEGGQTTTDSKVEIESSLLNVEYIPVYTKITNMNMFASPNKKINNQVEIGTYSTALMNGLQFTNYYESGKTNDMQTDLHYPLYMDIYGNIQTFSGKILIPAVSNAVFMTENTYFPYNAFFMNSYPIETSSNVVMDKMKGDPNKYVILVNKDTTAKNKEEDDRDPMVQEMEGAVYSIAKMSKKGLLEKSDHVRYTSLITAKLLPNIKPYLEIDRGSGKIDYIPVMSIVSKNEDALLPAQRYKILGLRNNSLVVDGVTVPAMFVDENVPAEKWNYNYFYGSDGDRGRLRTDLLVKVAESCYNNPEEGFDKLKLVDSQRSTPGFKLGSLLEPGHKRMSEAITNYILYTPSIAELPSMSEYLSTILIPLMNLLVTVAVVLAILQYVRNVKTMSIKNLLFSLLVIFVTNFALTNLYPATINTGFNSSVSRFLGENVYHLTLYNLEKDFNSKAEFIYTDNPTKIVSPGAYIKLANISDDEVKRYRFAQENAPWKDSKYYLPKWDLTKADLGETLFIKGNTLNIYVKDLFASTRIIHRNNKYEIVWDTPLEYTYYTPYLSILEGIVGRVNTFTSGRIAPKKIQYQSGYSGESGGALAYFSNEYFLVDREVIMNASEEHRENWELYNGGDFLNLRKVLYRERDQLNFPNMYEGDVKTTRWYKTAVLGRDDGDIERRILNVNLNVKNYIISLLPYMDNVTDDVIMKMIALYTTVEFNKEFSRDFLEVTKNGRDYLLNAVNRTTDVDYNTRLYPTRLELESISIDEHLKIGLVNIRDLLKFNVTSIYKFIENQAGWGGMLLFAINSFIMYIRSLLRISFITFVLMVVLVYMVIVYALRKDYSNKTVIGMIGVILTSWVVYAIDNIILLAFASTDKRSAGVLYLLLLLWTMWNIVGTAIYLSLFLTIFKDIKAFGGNIMYDSVTSVLNVVNSAVKAGLRLVSDTRSENFDITRPDLEMKSSEFERYLNMDMESKIHLQQQEIVGYAQNTLDSASATLKSKLPQQYTIKEYYAMNKGKEDMTLRSLPSTPEVVRDYMKLYGIEVERDVRTGEYLMSGKMDKWRDVVESNRVKKESFHSLYKQKEDGFYFPSSRLTKDYLNRSGIDYQEYGKTLYVNKREESKVQDIESTLKREVYRVETSKLDALNKVSGELAPGEYEVGKNHLYIKDEEKARELFGSDISKTYMTNHSKVTDYSDRLSTGGYILDNIDFLNGSMITNEYVEGKVNKEVFKTLLDQDIPLTPMGLDKYKFNYEDRDSILSALEGSMGYTEGREGVVFQSTSSLDNIGVWDDSFEKEDIKDPKEKEEPTVKSIGGGPGEEEKEEEKEEEEEEEEEEVLDKVKALEFDAEDDLFDFKL